VPTDHVEVKLDFSNAFNSLHQHDTLRAVHDRLPQLYAYCSSAYSQSSLLFHGPLTVLSQEGPQQGDQLGPVLFASTVQPRLCSLQSELNLGYLDDLTPGGTVESVASNEAQIARIGSDMGLLLNTSKFELIGAKERLIGGESAAAVIH